MRSWRTVPAAAWRALWTASSVIRASRRFSRAREKRVATSQTPARMKKRTDIESLSTQVPRAARCGLRATCHPERAVVKA